MTQVVVNDASCLIDLRKGCLLAVLGNLPSGFVVPLPVRQSESSTDGAGAGSTETHALGARPPPNRRRRNPGIPRQIVADFATVAGSGRSRLGPGAAHREPIVKPTVYVETSVVSYLTAWPSRDLLVAANQQVTHEWWRGAGTRFRLVVSELVIAEAGAGDPAAASARLAVLESLTLLKTKEETEALAERILRAGAIPEAGAADATHVAVAVTHGVDYLVTWNFRHIANAANQRQMDRICREAGYDPVVLCSPAQLMEGPS